MNNSIEKIYMLTPVQEGMLYHSLQDKSQFMDQYSCKLVGSIDLEYLKEAWNQVVRDNDVLRTAFVWENVENNLQVVLKKYDLNFKYLDLRNMTSEEAREKFLETKKEEFEKGFELDKAPLTRFVLLQAAEDAYYFVWTIHHMVVDGMSLPYLLGCVFDHYKYLIHGEQLTKKDALPYKAYVDWIKRQDKEKANVFWKEYLEGFTEPTNVVLYRHGEGMNDGDNIRKTIEIPEDIVNKVTESAKVNGLAPFQFHSLAYSILLSRFSGSLDVVYGVTVSGRPVQLKGITDTVGVFINAVPTRTNLKTDETVISYLKEATVQQIDRNPYEYLPYGDIAAVSDVGMGLYESLFTFENYKMDNIYEDTDTGFTIAEEWIHETTNYPLNWIVRPSRTTTVNAVYNTNFLNDEVVGSLLEQYVSILNQIASNVQCKISELDFEAGKPLIKKESATLTDKELERRAGQLARLLEGKEKVVVIARDHLLRSLSVYGAYLTGYTPEIIKEFSYRYVASYESADCILCDLESYGFLEDEYQDKSINLDGIEWGESQTGEWKQRDTEYIGMYLSKYGTDSITVAGMEKNLVFLNGKRVYIDSDISDYKFMTNLILHILMGKRTVLLQETEEEFDCLFTTWEQLEGWIDKKEQLGFSKVYLPWDAVEEEEKADAIQKAIEAGIEIQLYIEDLETAMILYIVTYPEHEIVHENAVLVDKNGNRVPPYFIGEVALSGVVAHQRSCGEKEVYTGNIARVNGQNQLELFVERSKTGSIDGRRVQFEYLVKYLVENRKVEDCFITYEDGYVFYYMVKGEQKDFLRKLSDAFAASMNVSVQAVKEAFVFCRVDAIYYDKNHIILEYKTVEATKRYTIHKSKDGFKTKEKEKQPELVAQLELTPDQKDVLAIWEVVLKKDIREINENFFDLGGNSLDIMKVISRMNMHFGVKFEIDDVIHNPTIKELSDLIEIKRQEAGNSIAIVKPELTQEQKRNGLPISFSQRRFWFIHQYDNQDYFYNGVEAVRLYGKLEIDCLEKAVMHVTRTQEILRTVFKMDNSILYQCVLDEVPDIFSVVSFSEIEQYSTKEEMIKMYIQEESKRAFDFENGPLFHCTVLRISEEESLFILVIHHIISDGWSVSIFINNLMKAYQYYYDGTIGLPEAPAWQFGEFSTWQQEMFNDEVMDEQLSFWKNQLKDYITLHLPYDHNRPAVQSYKGQKFICNYSFELSNQVKGVAQKTGVTPYVVYLVALNVILARLSGQDDIIIGAPVTNRPIKETEENIGCFMNTVILRNRLSHDLTFEEFIGHVQAGMIDAYKHQELPFDMLVEKLGIKRDLSMNPVFQVLFMFQNEPHPDQEIAGLSIVRENVDNQASMFDISISMEENESGVRVFFEYSTDLFEEDTIRNMAQYYENTIQVLCNSLDRNVYDFDYVTEDMLQANISKIGSLQSLFASALGTDKDRTVLCSEHEKLSGNDILVRSEQIARGLRKKGIEKDTPVLFYIEPQNDTLINLCALWMAGLTGVPVWKEISEEQIQKIAKITNAEYFLSNASISELPEGITLLEVEEGEASCSLAETTEGVFMEKTEQDVLLLLYQNEGEKEILTEYKGWQLVESVSDYQSVADETELYVLWNRPNWNANVLLGMLDVILSGRAIFAISKEQAGIPSKTLEFIKENKITSIRTSALFLQELMRQETFTQTESLKHIWIQNEALSEKLVTKVEKTGKRIHYLSEKGLVGMEYVIVMNDGKCRINPRRSVMYLLDSNNCLVGKNVTGQLSRKDNDSIVKTGILASNLMENEFIYEGTSKRACYINGNTVFLSEVESAILSLPEVDSATVVVDEKTKGLIAYYILNKEEQQNDKSLKEKLKGGIPDYMIPEKCIPIEAFVFKADGICDFEQLPKEEPVKKESSAKENVGGDEVESIIKDIWKQVLGKDDMGLQDNFFELGGTSLLLIEVYYILIEKFKTKLTPVDLFKYPTIESISRFISKKGKKTAKAKTEEVQQEKKQSNSVNVRRRNNERLKELRSNIKL